MKEGLLGPSSSLYGASGLTAFQGHRAMLGFLDLCSFGPLRELNRKHKDFMVDQGLYRPFDGFNSDFIGFCKFFVTLPSAKTKAPKLQQQHC